MITLIQLEYIIAVDTHRHFAKAAQKCFVTQPTLSMQIKKLEERLGVVIFDRSKQPVAPTDIGKKIIEQSRIILRESHKLPQIIKSFDDFVSGSLTIGIIPTIAPFLATQIIGSFIKKYPGVSIHIKELNSRDLITDLKKDLIDLGILAAPVFEESISTATLFYEEIFLYINHDEYLNSHNNVDTSNNLVSKILKEDYSTEEIPIQLYAYYKNTNGKSFFKYEGESIEALKLLVEKEGGFTFIPEMAAKASQPNDRARFTNFKELKPLREIIMVGNKQNPNERLAKLLAKHIKENISANLLDGTRGKIIGSPYE